MSSTTGGWQTAIHPGDLPAPPKRWRSITASGVWGEVRRLPDAFPTSKHGAVGIGFAVSQFILESPRGSLKAPSVTRAPAAATPTHAWIAP